MLLLALADCVNACFDVYRLRIRLTRCAIEILGGIIGEVAMIHQLRVYEIFEHNKAAFLVRFREHAARIMATYGFEIVWMWECSTPERAEFVYLLAWPDEETMLRSWEAFKADEEWKAIKRATNAEHGDLVGAIEERVLVPFVS
jgi:heme-degrading monooxygenase HmoA